MEELRVRVDFLEPVETEERWREGMEGRVSLVVRVVLVEQVSLEV